MSKNHKKYRSPETQSKPLHQPEKYEFSDLPENVIGRLILILRLIFWFKRRWLFIILILAITLPYLLVTFWNWLFVLIVYLLIKLLNSLL